MVLSALDTEEYRSGYNENDSKSFDLERGPWVRIPPPPPLHRYIQGPLRLNAKALFILKNYFYCIM